MSKVAAAQVSICTVPLTVLVHRNHTSLWIWPFSPQPFAGPSVAAREVSTGKAPVAVIGWAKTQRSAPWAPAFGARAARKRVESGARGKTFMARP